MTGDQMLLSNLPKLLKDLESKEDVELKRIRKTKPTYLRGIKRKSYEPEEPLELDVSENSCEQPAKKQKRSLDMSVVDSSFKNFIEGIFEQNNNSLRYDNATQRFIIDCLTCVKGKKYPSVANRRFLIPTLKSTSALLHH